MSRITRRAALAAIPACGLAPIVPAMAEPVDPLVKAIEAYHAGNRAFCALPDNFAPYANEDEAIEATYGPPFDALNEWDQPAQSMEGVREAIRVVLKEGCVGCDLETALLTAALAYLEAQA